MEPLDLTTSPPRGPREAMLGLTFMPRTIDKIRAEMPGGTIGPYLNESRGISAFMCRRIGVDMEALRAAVIAAKDDGEVETWLRERSGSTTSSRRTTRRRTRSAHRAVSVVRRGP
jgi:hypothetical protein